MGYTQCCAESGEGGEKGSTQRRIQASTWDLYHRWAANAKVSIEEQLWELPNQGVDPDHP